MNSTKQHAFPKYDEYSAILEYGSFMDTKFSAMFCQNLVEQIETYAQWSIALPQMKAELMETRMILGELIAHLHTLPSRSKAERKARTALLERAERILCHDQNDQGTVKPSESAG